MINFYHIQKENCCKRCKVLDLGKGDKEDDKWLCLLFDGEVHDA